MDARSSRRKWTCLTALAACVLLLSPVAGVAHAASQARVTAGTLSIDGTENAALSGFVVQYTDRADLFGPPLGRFTADPLFAYGPRYLWRGASPTPGAGCGGEPATAFAPSRISCSGVTRIDVALGRADDYFNVTASEVPVQLTGGAGDDGLRLSPFQAEGILDGGPGDDSLRLERTGTVRGGSGDDFIALRGRGLRAECGPGNDNVDDDQYYVYGLATIDEATCGPALRPVDAPPPSEPDEASFPQAARQHDGRVTLRAFRPNEGGRGTIRLMRPRSVTSRGFPNPDTKWAACSERRRFRMRTGRAVRTTLPLVPRVARQLKRLKRPGRRFSSDALIPCSLHISGVDDDGERFHRNTFTIVLFNPKYPPTGRAASVR